VSKLAVTTCTVKAGIGGTSGAGGSYGAAGTPGSGGVGTPDGADGAAGADGTEGPLGGPGVKGAASYSGVAGAVLNVASLTVTPAKVGAGTKGKSYSVTLKASGGTAPYHWQAFGLPAGLSVSASSGALSGKPTASGTFVVVVSVHDSKTTALLGTKTYKLTIAKS